MGRFGIFLLLPLPDLHGRHAERADLKTHRSAVDGAGFECAIDGVLKKVCRLALNDKPGVWKIRFTDRASGLTSTTEFTVKER